MIHEFNAPFVFWTKVNNHKKIKDTLVPIIKTISNNDNSTVTVDGSTTTYYHQTYSYFTSDMIDDIILKPIEQMHTEKNLNRPLRFHLDALWWNNYTSGGRTKVHKHQHADWSGIYLLHLEEPNTTTFYSQYGEAPNIGYMNQHKVMDNAVEGDVMIFPSFMQHCADACTKNRIIVSFDVISEFERSPLVILN
tara:strand:- start:134 stop:712 length:579 start_codon:yes stop_codon:yes gene_type:complete